MARCTENTQSAGRSGRTVRAHAAALETRAPRARPPEAQVPHPGRVSAAVPLRRGPGVQHRGVLRKPHPRARRRRADLSRLQEAQKALHASRYVLPGELLQKR